jgi:hypothetical protein
MRRNGKNGGTVPYGTKPAVYNQHYMKGAKVFTRLTVNIEKNINIKSFKLGYCFAALTAFLGGVAIYAFFRNIDNIVLFRFFSKPAFLDSPRIPLRTGTIWGYLFVFNLPHGLWCLSGLLVIRAIWLTNTKWRAIYGGIFIAAISSLEIAQLIGNRVGTFDVLDLASYGVSAFVESITYNKFIRRRVL